MARRGQKHPPRTLYSWKIMYDLKLPNQSPSLSPRVKSTTCQVFHILIKQMIIEDDRSLSIKYWPLINSVFENLHLFSRLELWELFKSNITRKGTKKLLI